jgi:preprotein translocase subunit SecE
MGRPVDLEPMADFLAVLGIVAFVAVMLGLIWALDRV